MFPILKLSSSAAAMEDLAYSVLGVACLNGIYERFPLNDEVGLTFENLCLVEKVYRNIDQKDRLKGYRAQGCILESSTCL